jgi:hypothetical protein
MVAQLNHLIIPVRDKEKSARFLADILGLEVGQQWAHFLPVSTNNGVTLDFSDSRDFLPQHYAFLSLSLMRRSSGFAQQVSNSTRISTWPVPARSTICTADVGYIFTIPAAICWKSSRSLTGPSRKDGDIPRAELSGYRGGDEVVQQAGARIDPISWTPSQSTA